MHYYGDEGSYGFPARLCLLQRTVFPKLRSESGNLLTITLFLRGISRGTFLHSYSWMSDRVYIPIDELWIFYRIFIAIEFPCASGVNPALKGLSNIPFCVLIYHHVFFVRHLSLCTIKQPCKPLHQSYSGLDVN